MPMLRNIVYVMISKTNDLAHSSIAFTAACSFRRNFSLDASRTTKRASSAYNSIYTPLGISRKISYIATRNRVIDGTKPCCTLFSSSCSRDKCLTTAIWNVRSERKLRSILNMRPRIRQDLSVLSLPCHKVVSYAFDRSKDTTKRSSSARAAESSSRPGEDVEGKGTLPYLTFCREPTEVRLGWCQFYTHRRY